MYVANFFGQFNLQLGFCHTHIFLWMWQIILGNFICHLVFATRILKCLLFFKKGMFPINLHILSNRSKFLCQIENQIHGLASKNYACAWSQHPPESYEVLLL